MKRMNTMLAIAVMVGISAKAEVKLPAFFSNNMVMQQQTECNLWGTADANHQVRIVTGWDKKTYKVSADNKGAWKLQVQTPKAGGPYTITFDDGKEKRLDNILIGELWLCSGQSNMEMPMKGFKNQPVEGANDACIDSKNDNIRLFTVKRNSTIEPQYDVEGTWGKACPETVREFSATAYYFGRMLNKNLNVPVGLIVSAWGGSACEAWMKADWLKAFPAAKIPQSQDDINKSKNRTPTGLYNAMLHPLIGMTMRGVIWYQGEDNWNRASTYADMFTKMVNGWREEWKQGDFPFYYCQIAPYDYGIITSAGQDTINSAFLREQQSRAELRLRNSGMVVLMDAGLEKGIHPMKKQVAGERLARLALVKTYGVNGITAESPYYKNIEIHNDTVTVFFERADMWINCHGSFESKNFEVAGADKKFYPAKAWIYRSKMMVKSDKVKNPVAVRYAFKNYADGDVFCEDLPLSSFRSDDWNK